MLTINSLANLLYNFTAQPLNGTTVSDVANANANDLLWLATTITSALQNMRGINPDLWRERPGITLAAPQIGTATVTFGSTSCTLGTLLPPSDGCTVRFSQGLDNELNFDSKNSVWVLRRPHDGVTGLQSAQLWQDSWIAADGTVYENVLGDVLANEIPIVAARTMNAVELSRIIPPWWDYGSGWLNGRKRFAGRILAVVWEPWASPFTNQIQTRLRFTPMPAWQNVIDANFLVAAPTITPANIQATSPAVPLQTPAGLDESITLAFALNEWASSPTFRVESSRKGIAERYAKAEARLRDWRGQQSAKAEVMIHGW